jgi:hypothetical protein
MREQAKKFMLRTRSKLRSGHDGGEQSRASEEWRGEERRKKEHKEGRKLLTEGGSDYRGGCRSALSIATMSEWRTTDTQHRVGGM